MHLWWSECLMWAFRSSLEEWRNDDVNKSKLAHFSYHCSHTVYQYNIWTRNWCMYHSINMLLHKLFAFTISNRIPRLLTINSNTFCSIISAHATHAHKLFTYSYSVECYILKLAAEFYSCEHTRCMSSSFNVINVIYIWKLASYNKVDESKTTGQKCSCHRKTNYKRTILHII